MTGLESKVFVPITFVFHPVWWNKNYGISFNKDFFYDPDTRVEADLQMRKALRDYLGDLGLEQEEDIRPRPCIGGVHIAAGYIISEMFGCKVKYSEDRAPRVYPKNISDSEVDKLEPVKLKQNPVFKRVERLVNKLEDQFGYVVGDINWSGVLNIALELRGQQLLIDMKRNPERARRIFDAVVATIEDYVSFIESKTGTTSISVNRSVKFVNPKIHLHSNCSVAMISPETYKQLLLAYDRMLSNRFQPYGIHHDGNNLHEHADGYSLVPNVGFYDVGWGSDISVCRQKLPEAFFNLRYDPKKMGEASPKEVRNDVARMLRESGDPNKTGFCCINMMEGDAPKANLAAAVKAVRNFREEFRR